ncbi:MAG TPA: ABC transporter substrate-binding protein [Steroidobacteraceae bacterium]
MIRTSSIACVALTLLCLVSRAPAADSGPQHVMSLSMCTDDLLLELLPPERIASVTYYSRDRGNSYQWPQAAKVRINWGTVEEVLAEKPDLVLAGTYTTPAARSLLKKFHWPLLEVPPAADFDEIRAVTRQVAHVLRREAVGEALIEKMDATLQQLAASRPRQIIRVAAWGEGRSIPGKGTLFDAILNAAGGVNIAASPDGGAYASFEVEQLIAAHPDILAYASDIADTPGLNTELAQHPLIRRLYSGRTVTYPGALYSCGVVESADAAVALRSSLLHAMRNGS